MHSFKEGKLEPSRKGNLAELAEGGYERKIDLQDDFDQQVSQKIKRVLKSHKIEKILD